MSWGKWTILWKFRKKLLNNNTAKVMPVFLIFQQIWQQQPTLRPDGKSARQMGGRSFFAMPRSMLSSFTLLVAIVVMTTLLTSVYLFSNGKSSRRHVHLISGRKNWNDDDQWVSLWQALAIVWYSSRVSPFFHGSINLHGLGYRYCAVPAYTTGTFRPIQACSTGMCTVSTYCIEVNAAWTVVIKLCLCMLLHRLF